MPLAVVKEVDEPCHQDYYYKVGQNYNVAEIVFNNGLLVTKGTNFDCVLNAECLNHYHWLRPVYMTILFIFEFLSMFCLQSVWVCKKLRVKFSIQEYVRAVSL